MDNCFAMAIVKVLSLMGLDSDIEDLYNIIGHDGNEIWWPEADGFKKYRGIHPQEIIRWLMSYGYTLSMIERFPQSAPRGLEHEARYIWDNDKMFWSMIKNKYGVLILESHAVAWNGSLIFDPAGYIGFLRDKEIREAHLAFLVCEIKSVENNLYKKR